MKILSFKLIFLFFLSPILGLAQNNVMHKLESIKPMVSTKSDVRRILGEEGSTEVDSTWYYFPNMSIEIIYSNGNCTEEWSAPRDTVIKLSAHFFDPKKLSELKAHVNLKKLQKQSAYDILGEKYYSDEKKGIGYGVNEKEKTWFSVKYFPSEKHIDARCKS